MLLSKSGNFIGSILLYFVHLVINFVVFLKHWFNYWQRKVALTGDIDSLKYNSLKLPNHIVFVINYFDNPLTIDDIASLVTWSIHLGISNISLYDSEGLLIDYKSELERSISRKLKLNDQIIFKGSQQNGSTQHNIIFNCDYDCSRIRILSLLNSKAIMAMVLKELIKHRLEGKLVPNDESSIRPDEIDKALFYKLNLPDPELAVICSPTPCLLGLLPWHVRLTEIVNLPHFGKLIPQDFIYVINRYTKCEQRFGK